MVAKVVGKAEKDPSEVVIKNLQAQLDLTTEEADNWERRRTLKEEVLFIRSVGP